MHLVDDKKILVYNAHALTVKCLHDSIVVSIPACHAGDRGSIPRRGAFFYFLEIQMLAFQRKIFIPLVEKIEM